MAALSACAVFCATPISAGPTTTHTIVGGKGVQTIPIPADNPKRHHNQFFRACVTRTSARDHDPIVQFGYLAGSEFQMLAVAQPNVDNPCSQVFAFNVDAGSLAVQAETLQSDEKVTFTIEVEAQKAWKTYTVHVTSADFTGNDFIELGFHDRGDPSSLVGCVVAGPSVVFGSRVPRQNFEHRTVPVPLGKCLELTSFNVGQARMAIQYSSRSADLNSKVLLCDKRSVIRGRCPEITHGAR